MLKVNEEKLLLDHKELVEKKEANLAAIEADAKAYAIGHNYDEATTAKFVAFTQEIQGNGLTADESEKLDILNSYIEEVEEVVTEAEETADTVINGATLRVGVVNNI